MPLSIAVPHRKAPSPRHPFPPADKGTVAGAVPEFWRKALEDRAYQLAYKASRERNFHAWPSTDELATRLNGYALKLYGAAAPGYAEVWEICEIALARIIRRGQAAELRRVPGVEDPASAQQRHSQRRRPSR